MLPSARLHSGFRRPSVSIRWWILGFLLAVHQERERSFICTDNSIWATPASSNGCWRPKKKKKNSVAGTRTRVSRVRAEYPNQLDYNGSCCVAPCATYTFLNFSEHQQTDFVAPPNYIIISLHCIGNHPNFLLIVCTSCYDRSASSFSFKDHQFCLSPTWMLVLFSTECRHFTS